MPEPRTVHLTTGLPASGKTTVARRLVAESGGRVRRVNLDDIRAMLDPGQPWSREHERTAVRVQDAAILACIEGGYDLVVDNTHLTPFGPGRLRDVFARTVVWVVHDLTGVPLEECIRRDAERARTGGRSVGEAAIRELYERHLAATADGWRLTPEWLAAPA
jgi:predicted kinase